MDSKTFTKIIITMLSADGLSVEFNGKTLFKDISFYINEKDRIALMGKNGAGKSQSMRAESRMKYLGSDCGDVKPLTAPTAAASAGSKAARPPGPGKSGAAKP